ncbi:MAG: InlB B-repeat-containing protein [Solirubrobacterales bacterium]
MAIVAAPKSEKYLWFTDRGTTPAIGVIDSASPEAVVKECSAGLNPGSMPLGIAVGPDGNLWFTDGGTTRAIGTIDPSNCKIEEFSTGLNAESAPRGIVAGPDGNLWFTDSSVTTRAIGKVNPTTHAIEEFATGENSEPGFTNSPLGPWGIAAGPDGNVWFAENGNNATEGRSEAGKAIGRITPSGTITYFSTGLAPASKPTGLTAAPDGKLWFTDGSGITEKQGLAFSGATGGQEFEVCDEAAKKCAKFKYTTITSTTTRTTTKNAIKAAYETVYGAGTIGALSSPATTCGGTCSFTVPFEEFGKLVATNVGQTACKTGGTGTCSTSTTENGIPQAVGSITTGGSITRYPVDGLYSANGLAYGPGGNVWFSAGVTSAAQIGKLGVEAETLTVKKTGTGTGTVTSTPSGINCGSECAAGFVKGETVKLSQSAAEGSKFTGWSGACSGTGACEVTMSEAKEVKANFDPIPYLLTVSKTGSGTGAVTSSPAGINCGSECSAEFNYGTVVSLSQEAGKGSKFTGWSGACSGTGECKVTLSKSEGVTANFDLIPKYALTVKKTGLGTGTVISSPSGINCGSECSAEYYEGTEVTLSQEASPGSKFTGWGGACSGTGTCKVTMSAAKEVTANFDKIPGPTNRRTITLTKTPAGNAGAGLGSVSSKPKGIKCAQTCNEAVGRFFKEQAVVLTAVPSGEGSSFDKWEGCPEPAGLICTVPAGKAGKSIKAIFKGTSKAFTPAEALTLSKGESEQNFGWGTVKAAGLTCEAECDGTVALYQGPVTVPKFKAGKTVELKETPAFGSKFVGWTGACSGTETSCKVTMEEAKSVTAEFAAVPNKALTVEKAYEGGLGSVASKPKGINCGTTCTATSANMPEGTSVLLTAKAATTTPATTFVKWEGGDCEGKTEATCTVGMDKAETVKAVFSGPVKAINKAKTLALAKEGSGFGTIKAGGLTCEVSCTGATSLYYGPVTEPKFKAGAKVILKATPAPGSTAVTWSGCKVLNATECEVVMETNASVTAKFDELE